MKRSLTLLLTSILLTASPSFSHDSALIQYIPPAIQTAVEHTQKPTREQQALINELMGKLIGLGHDPKRVIDMFSNENFGYDSRIGELEDDNLIERADRGEVAWEDFAEIIDLEGLIKIARGNYDKYFEDLVVTRMLSGVDERYPYAGLVFETKLGDSKNLGRHLFVNTFASMYIDVPRKQERAINQLSAMLRLSKKWGIEADRINDISCSEQGCFGPGQWLVTTAEQHFVGKNWNFKGADIWDLKDNLYSAAHHYRYNTAMYPLDRERAIYVSCQWNPEFNGMPIEERDGNWFAIWAYNRSSNYIKVVDAIAQSLPYLDDDTVLKKYGEILFKRSKEKFDKEKPLMIKPRQSSIDHTLPALELKR